MLVIRRRVEQLELIGELLDRDTPSSCRLAEILADNFAEIIMHDRARYELAKEQSYRGFRLPRWSASKREAVMNEFGAKVNFLSVEIGVVDPDDAVFFKFGHWIRNRAYHADAYHPDVIGAIARTYFGKLCRLYPQLRPSGVVSSKCQAEMDFLKRHSLSNPTDLINGGMARICDALASPRACLPTDLAAALSRNLVGRIEAIVGTSAEYGSLRTLVEGECGANADEDEILKRIQFADSYEADPNPAKTDKEFRKAVAAWEAGLASYCPPVTVAKLRRWIGTARSIAKETTSGRAAERFRSMDEQFSRVEDLVHQGVHEFDE